MPVCQITTITATDYSIEVNDSPGLEGSNLFCMFHCRVLDEDPIPRTAAWCYSLFQEQHSKDMVPTTCLTTHPFLIEQMWELLFQDVRWARLDHFLVCFLYSAGEQRKLILLLYSHPFHLNSTKARLPQWACYTSIHTEENLRILVTQYCNR